MSSGLAVAATVQPDRDSSRLESGHNPVVPQFTGSGNLLGTDVKNEMNDTIGSVENLIVDRGSGVIAYAVIQSGDFLGLGGKSFALPYGQLTYDAASDFYKSSLSKEQIERQTEFLPENWTDLSHTTWMEKMDGWISDDDEDAQERFRKAAHETDRVEINGTVAEVSRVDGPHGEQAVLRVIDKDGTARKVVLGPTWYVMGSERTPMSGDPVRVTAIENDGHTHAMSVESQGQTMHYRSPNGDAQWSASDLKMPRYLLVSDLVGRSVNIDGVASGEVQRALIETGSGRVAFLGFDPNENFLGIGDTIALVPWSAFRIGAETVALDANQRTVERALAWPDDLEALSTHSTLALAYEPFGAQVPNFGPRARVPGDESAESPTPDHVGDAWAMDSAIIRTLVDGKQETIEGEFRGLSTMSVMEGAADARVMTVETADGARHVIIGPDWYASHQEFDLAEGDPVTVRGRSATINGLNWTAAWTITHGSDTWSFWNDSTPVWAK